MWKIILLACFVHCALSVRVKRTNTEEGLSPLSVVWDKARNSAYYVDFGKDSPQPCLFRYDATKKCSYSAYIEGPSLGTPSFIIPNKDGKTFTVGFPQFVGIFRWNGKDRSAIFLRELFNARDRLGPNERISIGHRDPTGNALYASTIDRGFCGVPANQTVYVKRRGSERTNAITQTLRSGFGFGFAHGCVYVLDSCDLKIWAIPDPDSKCKHSKCDKERLVIDFTKHGKSILSFFLMGLEADSKGILYSADYYTGDIYSIDPITCKFRREAKLPVAGTTSVSFGDDNRHGQNLYITVVTGLRNVLTGQVKSQQSTGTALFKAALKTTGVTFKRLKV